MHQWEFLILVGYVAGVMTPNVLKNMFKASLGVAKQQMIEQETPAKTLKLEGEKIKIS